MLLAAMCAAVGKSPEQKLQLFAEERRVLHLLVLLHIEDRQADAEREDGRDEPDPAPRD